MMSLSATTAHGRRARIRSLNVLIDASTMLPTTFLSLSSPLANCPIPVVLLRRALRNTFPGQSFGITPSIPFSTSGPSWYPQVQVYVQSWVIGTPNPTDEVESGNQGGRMSVGGRVSVECRQQFGGICQAVVVFSCRYQGVGTVSVEYPNRIKMLSTVRAMRSVNE